MNKAEREEAERQQRAQWRRDRGDVDEVKLPGHHRLISGVSVFTVSGERGEFLFTSARVAEEGVQWVEGFQVKKGLPGHARSFYPERVKSVKRRKVEG